MTTAALLLAALALAVSLATVAVAALVMRQSGQTTTDLRRHRLAHSRTEGTPDPDRRNRERTTGPPPGTPERRTPNRYQPPPPDPDATSELERTDLPTTALRAQHRDRPDPRNQP